MKVVVPVKPAVGWKVRPVPLPVIATVPLAACVIEVIGEFFGTTVYAGKVAFRPAIVNWRTRSEDVDLVVPIVLELGGALRSEATARSAQR